MTSWDYDLLLAALKLADAGMVDIDRPHYGGACAVKYRLSTGHNIQVFDDAGEWDYIEEVTFPDGRQAFYDNLPDSIRHWERSDDSHFIWKSEHRHELEEGQ